MRVRAPAGLPSLLAGRKTHVLLKIEVRQPLEPGQFSGTVLLLKAGLALAPLSSTDQKDEIVSLAERLGSPDQFIHLDRQSHTDARGSQFLQIAELPRGILHPLAVEAGQARFKQEGQHGVANAAPELLQLAQIQFRHIRCIQAGGGHQTVLVQLGRRDHPADHEVGSCADCALPEHLPLQLLFRQEAHLQSDIGIVGEVLLHHLLLEGIEAALLVAVAVIPHRHEHPQLGGHLAGQLAGNPAAGEAQGQQHGQQQDCAG
jgi:hypothetical protein